mgnify:FL=1
MATPITSLDLDDISAQLMLEGCQYNVLFSYTLFNEEAPFYEQFGRGGTILWVILERRLMDVFIHVQNYAGGRLVFHFMVHALPGGMVI